MKHHSNKGLLVLRRDDIVVISHILRTLGFLICAMGAVVLIRFWTGEYQHELIGPAARTLLSILYVVVVVLLCRWRPPKSDLYLRVRPVHYCKVCRYNLKGNVQGKCPECGTKNPTHLSRTLGFPFCRNPRFLTKEDHTGTEAN